MIYGEIIVTTCMSSTNTLPSHRCGELSDKSEFLSVCWFVYWGKQTNKCKQFR